MKESFTYRFLFAGGGTGGHLFPAVAIAEEVLRISPKSKILFVGTKHRIESAVIPKLGYDFKSISIKGMPRKFGVSIVSFLFSLILSLIQSLLIVMKFRPDVALGTGSYISVTPLFVSKVLNRSIVLAESNLYPGIATKVLAPIANQVHLSFEESKKYFKQKEGIFITGNPVRKNLSIKNRSEAAKFFNLSPGKKTILVLGGSLGAKSINEKMLEIYSKLTSDFQLIWQTGRNYFNDIEKVILGIYPDSVGKRNQNLVALPYIERMDYAYSMCDLLITRAGASTISEITNQGLASILIPSPNVAENHQYYNAMSFVNKGAAEILLDNESAEKLMEKILKLLADENKLDEMKQKVKEFSKPDAASVIANEVVKLASKRYNGEEDF